MIRYEWTDIHADIHILADKIEDALMRSGKAINAIVGIHRGGLIPAVMLSHLFDLPMKTLEWQTRDQGQVADVAKIRRILFDCPTNEVILIVDEIADSGKTLNDIQEQVNAANACFASLPIEVYYAVIVKRTACRLDMPVLSAHVLDSDEWVHFPWEAD